MEKTRRLGQQWNRNPEGENPVPQRPRKIWEKILKVWWLQIIERSKVFQDIEIGGRSVDKAAKSLKSHQTKSHFKINYWVKLGFCFSNRLPFI